MKTIRLLETGNYLLGIETSAIKTIFTPDQLRKNRSGETSLLPMLIFFAQRKNEISGTEQVIVQANDNKDGPLLLFEHDHGEYRGEPAPLPDRYPEQARLCCPEAMIYGEEVVLCLNPDRLYELYTDRSATEELAVSLNKLFKNSKHGSRPEQEKAVPQPVLSGKTEEMEKVSKTVQQKTAKENNEIAPGMAEAGKTTSPEEDSDPIGQMIAWIAREYDKRSSQGEVIISPDDIPLKMRRKAALDDVSLHYLINQTLSRLQRRQNR